ncbi:Heavy metal-associated domain, HMA [Sesbania bispinosa]|nr:Heavy metal-associated domain, HMA [Sesbania bispinosa]
MADQGKSAQEDDLVQRSALFLQAPSLPHHFLHDWGTCKAAAEARKSHKQVELLSPIPKPPDEKKLPEQEAKPEPEEKKEEPQIVIVILKVHMHCEACAQEMKRRIQRMKGNVKGVYGLVVIVMQEPEKKEKAEEAKEEKKMEEGEKEEKKSEGEENKEKKGDEDKEGDAKPGKEEAVATEETNKVSETNKFDEHAAGRRGSNFTGFEGSSSRPSSKYNGFNDYSSAKYGRGGDGRIPFGERFAQSDGNALGMRGRGPS